MSIMLLKDYSVENRKDGYDRCGMTVPLIVRTQIPVPARFPPTPLQLYRPTPPEEEARVGGGRTLCVARRDPRTPNAHGRTDSCPS